MKICMLNSPFRPKFGIRFGLNELDLDNKDQFRDQIAELLSTIEELLQAYQDLREENQRQKDEINWLKGEAIGEAISLGSGEDLVVRN